MHENAIAARHPRPITFFFDRARMTNDIPGLGPASGDIRPGPALSTETIRRIDLLFRPWQRQHVATLLATRCANNLPFLESLNAAELERYQFAALKLSRGTIEGLEQAVAVANQDWRDLLMAAGFGHSVRAHEKWLPEPFAPVKRGR
ncbi:MAG: hypothetical protein HY255_12990 [Betaproteobacteria bacterium]|nr:hypothetical protein [Betaproteobacteria bacterium]